jgi:catechol 2,3-dioxygenase-like lactoylglutathione lyase family enzyme
MKLEVVVVPVSDVDRAKAFYGGLGWREDADFATDDLRIVQFTPLGSACSINFGENVTTGVPGSLRDLQLTVFDIEAARAALIDRGVDVGEIFHDTGGVFHHAGTEGTRARPRPRRRQLRLVRLVQRPRRQRLAAAGDQGTASGPMTQEDSPMDVATLAGLLHETAEHHDPYEKSSPEHNWWDWYAAYLNARLEGSDSEEATRAAGIYMEGVLRAR